jgi:hypothetical protein
LEAFKTDYYDYLERKVFREDTYNDNVLRVWSPSRGIYDKELPVTIPPSQSVVFNFPRAEYIPSPLGGIALAS